MTPCYEKEAHEVARLYFDDRRGFMANFYITAIIWNAVFKIELVTCMADAPHPYYMNADSLKLHSEFSSASMLALGGLRSCASMLRCRWPDLFDLWGTYTQYRPYLHSTFVIILSSSRRLFTMWRVDMQGLRVERLLDSVDCARSSILII